MNEREELFGIARVTAPAIVFVASQLLLKKIGCLFCADAVREDVISSAVTCALLPWTVWAYRRRECRPRPESRALRLAGMVLSLALTLGLVLCLCRGVPDIDAAVRVLGWGVIGPINEEIVYRGFVYQRGRKCLPFSGAVLLSALMFAAGHATAVQFVAALIAAVLFAAVYERSGRLIVPIMLHIGWNLAACISEL